MAEEKIVTINTRKGMGGAPNWRRSKDLVSYFRNQVRKISRSKDVRIDDRLNSMMWSRGSETSGMKLKVKIIKDGEKVRVEPV